MKKTTNNEKTTNSAKNVQNTNGKVSGKTAKNTVKGSSTPKNCK